MLWGTEDQGRYVLEALMCGSHLQTYSDKDIRRIMYLCPDIARYPGTKLLSLVWEVRMCEHLQTSTRMQRATHNRLANVWSKLQLVELLHPEFDLCVVIDTDIMATQSLNDLFFHEAPAAVWRGTRTILEGKRRDARSYGTPPSGGKQLGGINGGLVLTRPNPREFQEMLRAKGPSKTSSPTSGKSRRHSYVAAKIQLPIAPGCFAGAGSARRFAVLEDGDPSLGGCGQLALQCGPETSGYGMGERRLSSFGGFECQ